MPPASSTASSRRSEKAEVDSILRGARAGELDTRARALTAHRVRVLRLAASTATDDTTADEDAGALLEADAQHAIMVLLESYAKVHSAQ